MTLTLSGSGNPATVNGVEQGLTLTTSTAQTPTSGTVVDFNGIPSWVKRITVICRGVTLSGTNTLLVQLGTSSGVQITGYLASYQSGTSGSGSSTSGFIIGAGTNTTPFSGTMTLTNVSGNSWVSNYAGKVNVGNATYGGGDVTLSGVLDRVRITGTGTNTFSTGTINIMYE